VIGEKNLTILKIKPYLIAKNVVNFYKQRENTKRGVVGVKVLLRKTRHFLRTFYV